MSLDKGKKIAILNNKFTRGGVDLYKIIKYFIEFRRAKRTEKIK